MTMNGKSLVIIATVTALAACAARKDPRVSTPDLKQGNEWLVRDYFNQQADNGLLADRTIRENHFLANSSEFSDLGVRDMAVFARHYRQDPGHLNIRRGGATDELYSARVTAVREYLEDRGVALDRVTVSDGPPTGDGMDMETALFFLYASTLVEPDYGTSSMDGSEGYRNTSRR